MSDDIIAVAKIYNNMDISEKEFINSITENINNLFKNSAYVKKERMYAVSAKISSSEIFDIESVIQNLENKLKGKMLNYGSGTFSYKDRFNELRNDIFSHPEKDWNVENEPGLMI